MTEEEILLRIRTELDARGLDDLGAKTDAAGGKMSKLGGALSGLAGPAAAGALAAGAAIAGIGAIGLSAAGEAVQGVKNLQAEMGYSAERAQELGDIGKQVFSNNWGESLGDAQTAVGLLNGAFNGLGDGPLKAVTEQALAFGSTFEVETADVTRGVTNLAAAFMDVKDQDPTRVLDQMTALMQTGGQRADDLVDSMQEYSPLMAELGLSSDQFFGLLDSGLAAGAMNTDVLGDAFKEFGIRLTDGSDATGEALQNLGLDDLAHRFRTGAVTGAEAFGLIQEKLNEFPPAMRAAQGGVALFGTKFEDLGPTIFEALSLDPIENFEGAAMKAGNTASSSLGAMWETIKRTAVTTLGTAFEPLVKNLQEKGPEILGAILPKIQELGTRFAEILGGIDIDAIIAKVGEIDFAGIADKVVSIGSSIGGVFTFLAENPAIAKIAAIVGGLAAAFGAVMVVLGPFIPIVTGVVSSISGLVAGAGGLSAILTTVAAVLTGPVAIAIGVLVGGFILWQTKGDEIKAWMGELGDWLGAKWTEIKDWTITVLTDLGAAIGVAWDSYWADVSARLTLIVDTIKLGWETAKTAISDALTAIGESIGLRWDAFLRTISDKLKAILGAVTTAWESVRSAVDEAMEKTREIINSVWDAIGATIDDSLSRIQGFVSSALDWIADKTGVSMDTIKSIWNNAVGGIRDLVAGAIEIIKGDWEGGLSYMREGAYNVWQAVTIAFRSGVDTVLGLMRSLGSSIMSAIGNARDMLVSVGRDIIEGLKRGIQASWDTLRSWMTGLFGNLVDLAKRILGIASPSKVMRDEIGVPIGQGITGGVAAALKANPLGDMIELWFKKLMPGNIGMAAAAGLTRAMAPAMSAAMSAAMATAIATSMGGMSAVGGRGGIGIGPDSVFDNRIGFDPRMGGDVRQQGHGDVFDMKSDPFNPKGEGVNASGQRGGKGGILAASKSNYWRVFVNKWGVPEEGSARKTAAYLGIPLPEWLEQIYNPPTGETINAPDPMKDPEAAEVFKEFHKAIEGATGAMVELGKVLIPLKDLLPSRPVEGVTPIGPIGGGRGIGIPIPGPGQPIVADKAEIKTVDLTVNNGAQTIMLDGKVLARAIVKVMTEDTVVLDEMNRALGKRKAATS